MCRSYCLTFVRINPLLTPNTRSDCAKKISAKIAAPVPALFYSVRLHGLRPAEISVKTLKFGNRTFYQLKKSLAIKAFFGTGCIYILKLDPDFSKVAICSTHTSRCIVHILTLTTHLPIIFHKILQKSSTLRSARPLPKPFLPILITFQIAIHSFTHPQTPHIQAKITSFHRTNRFSTLKPTTSSPSPLNSISKNPLLYKKNSVYPSPKPTSFPELAPYIRISIPIYAQKK